MLDRHHPDGGCRPVVCARCGARTTLRSVWSTVDRCPHCLTPLMVSSRWPPVGPSALDGRAPNASADVARTVER
ncbi:MAG: hypothetical protein QOF04_962 [Solirubrobacteraceae bacterium]|nr:hypothetical protein [Solirubrobacteraceae bacterium]